MTKAELKKLETEKKYDFITRVYETVLSCIPAETKGYRKKVQVNIMHQNYSRYIRFHTYGADLKFRIYGDGNVAIELKEAFHSDHVEQIFEYTEDVDVQEAFLAELTELASGLIRVFIDRDTTDFHTYMDYVSAENSALTAYRNMKAEWS